RWSRRSTSARGRRPTRARCRRGPTRSGRRRGTGCSPTRGAPVARLPYLDREDLPEEHRPLLDRPINLFRGLAHNPDVLRWMEGIGRWIRFESRVDPRLREMAILQV